MPTDHNERSGPTIFGKRHTNDPFCSDVRLGFLVGFFVGFLAGFVVVVVGTDVVVGVTAVVVVVGVVVVVVGAVVVDEAGTNFTGR